MWKHASSTRGEHSTERRHFRVLYIDYYEKQKKSKTNTISITQ